MNNDLSSNNSQEEKILFVVSTEFALLIAMLHYLENLAQSGSAVFIILKRDANRFKNINFDSLPGEYHVFNNNISDFLVTPDREFEKVLDLYPNVSQIVFQHPYDLLTQVILQSYLNKNDNILLTLINDGLTRSIDIVGWEKYKLYIKLFLRKYVDGMKLLSFMRVKQDIRSYIDYFIAEEDMGAKNFINTNTLLSKITEHKKHLNDFFNLNLDIFERSTILFFTQPIEIEPFFTDEHQKLHDEMLFKLADLAKREKIEMLLKIHPHESPEKYEKFTNDFVTVYKDSNVPAEVILNLVREKSIISIFSSLSLYENKQNKHFWLYKSINIDYPYRDFSAKKFISIPDNFDMLDKQILQYINKV